jgi:hypothetical protein
MPKLVISKLLGFRIGSASSTGLKAGAKGTTPPS